MKLRDWFIDDWDDGEGMPWLTLTPWKAASHTVVEAKLHAKDVVREYARHDGGRAVYGSESVAVGVRYDLEDGTTAVNVAIGEADGFSLTAPSKGLMGDLLEAWTKHAATSYGHWRWDDPVILALTMVRSIDGCHSFEAAEMPFHYARHAQEATP